MSIRDLHCAMQVGEVSKLGGLETEFTVFGCGYMEDDKVKYRASSKQMEIYGFFQECSFKGIYPTSMMTKTYRKSVPPDLREEVAQGMKVQLASDIKKAYSSVYFENINLLSRLPAQNNAYLLLQKEIETAEGRFDEDQMLRIEGLAQLAYESKQLNQQSLDRKSVV